MKKVTKTAQIRALYEKGMNNKQIAETLGFKLVYVGQITNNYRKQLAQKGESIETHGKPAIFPPFLKTKNVKGFPDQTWKVTPKSKVLWDAEQSNAEAERKAILDILWGYAGRKDLSDSDQSLLKHLYNIIVARGLK
jgi:hypothetical protein